MKHSLFSLRAKPNQLSRAGSLLPQDELVDEEACPAYNSKNFYPAIPGEILANRYQALVKIGWGTRSTVWLARDTRRYVPLLCQLQVFKLLMEDSLDTDGSLNAL
jgi:hypothetical protein